MCILKIVRKSIFYSFPTLLNLLFPPFTAICIILVHLLIEYRLHFLPESVAVVSLGEYPLHFHVGFVLVQGLSALCAGDNALLCVCHH